MAKISSNKDNNNNNSYYALGTCYVTRIVQNTFHENLITTTNIWDRDYYYGLSFYKWGKRLREVQ